MGSSFLSATFPKKHASLSSCLLPIDVEVKKELNAQKGQWQHILIGYHWAGKERNHELVQTTIHFVGWGLRWVPAGHEKLKIIVVNFNPAEWLHGLLPHSHMPGTSGVEKQ